MADWQFAVTLLLGFAGWGYFLYTARDARATEKESVICLRLMTDQFGKMWNEVHGLERRVREMDNTLMLHTEVPALPIPPYPRTKKAGTPDPDEPPKGTQPIGLGG